MEKEPLQLSGIQHFAFCRRQWALIHIENQWVENGLTAEGRSQHSRVHDHTIVDHRNGVIVLRDLAIHSDALGLSGACDAVELIPDPNGIPLQGRTGTFRIYPVEYKHGKTKMDDCDRLQVAAQAICLEEMLCCEIPEAALYYMQTKHRETVFLTAELRQRVHDAAYEMHALYDRGTTPRVKAGKQCNNCSMRDLCLPNITGKMSSMAVKEYIEEHVREKSCI